MIFTLEIKLDNDEVAQVGIDNALPIYLADVIVGVTEGRADAGIVWDGNGNTIGRWLTSDDEPDDAEDNASQFVLSLPDHSDTDERPLPDDGDNIPDDIFDALASVDETTGEPA